MISEAHKEKITKIIAAAETIYTKEITKDLPQGMQRSLLAEIISDILEGTDNIRGFDKKSSRLNPPIKDGKA